MLEEMLPWCLALLLSFSKGSFKSFGCWGAGEAAFVVGMGQPSVRGADSRRQNLLVEVTGKRENIEKKKKSLPPRAQYFLVTP